MALTGLRVAGFDRFFAEHVESGRRPAPTRLELSLSAGAETTARELAARESSCCSFFVFTFDGDAIMRIEVPAAQVAVLDALAARVDLAIESRSDR
ncbi:hypothetical protein [Nocardia sp. MH4]|uniref:hypothetical protein n=1 Tax=Nocardia sp. MH4 TaxID=1768677 RepID=UPI0027E2FA99|nr:hypothetical protein [Nocardia sp. MH4]